MSNLWAIYGNSCLKKFNIAVGLLGDEGVLTPTEYRNF